MIFIVSWCRRPLEEGPCFFRPNYPFTMAYLATFSTQVEVHNLELSGGGLIL